MSLRVCLKKSCLSFLITGLVLGSINLCGAQVLSAIPGIGNVDLGSVKVVPFSQVGYKNIGFNFSLPSARGIVTQSNIDYIYLSPALDLQFQDAGVWVGSIGLDTRLLSTFLFTLRAEGNASKNIDVFTGENAHYWGTPPYNWSGSPLKWWDVDGMVGYTFYRDWSVVMGVRYDYLTVGLRNPVDSTGAPFIVPRQITSLIGDIIVKTWIPYIGLELYGTNYKASLVYSQFASLQVIYSQSFLNSIPFWFVNNHNYLWQFAKTGSFLEGSFEYNVPVLESLQFGLWASGTWTRFSGDGSLNLDTYDNPPNSNFPFSWNTTATLGRYEIGGGISASLSF